MIRRPPGVCWRHARVHARRAMSGGTSGHISRARRTERSLHSAPAPRRPRSFNFSAGPACLPSTVMERAKAEFTDWQGTGMSIMEMSHRDAGGPVQASISRASDLLRQLLQVPDNYHVLFFQGGAHAQFAAVPLNLMGDDENAKADYVRSGFWSQRAIDEASKFLEANTVADCESVGYKTIPKPTEWSLTPNAKYTHICGNETIHGLEFLEEPDYKGEAPLIIDMTSTLLSRPVDVSKYGAIYASGGKNLGPAGALVMIVRDDLLGRENVRTPSVLSWKKMSESTPIPSIYNTPPTFLIYMIELVLDDLLKKGGVEYAEEKAKRAAGLLYEIVDNSDGFYTNTVDPEFRSRMNVPFRIMRGGTTSVELETKFTQEAEEKGFLQVFGHPLFGGQRITLYNGIPIEAVYGIAEFMEDFCKKYK